LLGFQLINSILLRREKLLSLAVCARRDLRSHRGVIFGKRRQSNFEGELFSPAADCPP